jgi:Uma2 family endonuclease
MPNRALDHAAYRALPDDGSRYEVLAGEVVVSPSAGSPHQALQAALIYEFMARIGRKRRGQVFADLDCELLPHDIVRPDLLVVLPEHRDRILPTHVRGTPDLCVEILSPSTAQRDGNEKLARYAAAGTPELWLVCGLTRTVTRFVHDGRGFGPPTVASAELELAILPDVVIPFAEIW